MRNIVYFALPYMLSYFLQILYGLADLFVIGQFCGVDSTTAVSNGAQVMHMFTVIIIGLAMGTTVRTAHTVGARDREQTARTVGNTITLFMGLSVVLAVALLLACSGIVHLMDTPAEAVAETAAYLTICFIGIPFIVAYNIIASIFRGLGDSKSPMYFIAIACVVNVALDYLLIGLFGMGAAGAALATTLSQMCSVIFAYVAIRRQRSMLDITRKDLKPHKETLSRILKIGIPVAMQDGFIQVAFVVIMIIANGRGLNDAAAVGIVEKFIGLLFIIPSAMLSTVSAISAQNIGAGKTERALTTLRYAIGICVAYGLVVGAIFQFIPDEAVRLFTDDAKVITLGGEYLQSYSWDCLFAGIQFSYSGLFTACGYSIISFGHNFLSIVFARIPLSYFGSEMYPDTLYPMGIASPAGSLVSVIICIVVYRWLKKRDKFRPLR